MAKKSPQEFIKAYKPIAEQVGKEIGVDPNVILSQWALESNWGSAVPASHNLAGIKDFSGKGTAAKDNKLGTTAKYVQFEDPEVFGMYYADMIKRQFPNAVNTGPDIGAFTRGLVSGRSGAYFEADPQKYAVGLTAIHNSIPGAEQASRPDMTQAEPTQQDGELVGVMDDQRREAIDRENLEAQEKRQAQVYGGAAGAGLSAAKATGSVAGSLVKAVSKLAEEGRQAASPTTPAAAAPGAVPGAPGASPVAAPGAQAAAPQGAPGAARLSPPMGTADAGRMAAGQTGNMVYNYGKAAGLTDIEAARALDMTRQSGGVHDLSTVRREGTQRVQNLFPTESWIENPRYGGLMTMDQGVGQGPRASFAVQAPVRDVPPGTLMGPAAPPPEGALREIPRRVPVPTTTAPQAPSGLEQVSQKFSNMMRSAGAGLAAVSRYVAPPLTLASAAGEGVNIAQQFRRPSSSGLDVLGQPMVGAAPERDYTSMGLSAGNILGGALSLARATSIPGIVLSAGTAAVQAYRDNPEARDLIVRRLQEASQTPSSDPMTGNIYP
jgi:hypothetical protein